MNVTQVYCPRCGTEVNMQYACVDVTVREDFGQVTLEGTFEGSVRHRCPTGG